MRTNRHTNRHRSASAAGTRGVALVIVLAFVVLLTGLIIAFFSRSITDRQISNSSVSRAKVSTFADGAADAVIGELKQEIVDSSSSAILSTGTVYFPLTPAAMLPQITGTTGVSGSLAANILKISDPGQVFYSSSNAAITIPASGKTNVTTVSTTTPSLNGRVLTAAYWNQHYLLPSTSSSDSTPTTSSFVPPSWILVARDGSNPTAWSSSLITSASNTSSVVGRYAFAIYHEGGLLDVNAAGYPYPATSGTWSLYKNSEAYADLTQIPGLSSTQINELVAWRNFASIPVPGQSFQAPNFSATSADNYYTLTVSNTTGYLCVSGTASANNQTDHMFGNRQQLIKFFQNALGLTSGTNLTPLNYLTTFSRDLNQPSLAPLPASATPDTAHRPAVVVSGSGGNDAYGGDNVINPSFLAVTATSSFTRNDGTTAVVGEPLVKKRFALNRLAWITYAGPITMDGQSYNPGLKPTYVSTLKNVYGFTDAFLLKGTPLNVYKYFGLSWVSDPNNSTLSLWVYNHQGAYPLTTATNVVPSTIETLGTGGSNPVLGREADFVELLRAAINVGAIAKASATPGVSSGASGFSPDSYEANLDVLSNEAIIQIFANIIGQYTLDNYPPRILYNDGGLSQFQEFDGVKDLPYFYRVRGGLFKVKESNPAFTSSQANATVGTVMSGSEGLGVGLEEPEIWNPHSWNVNATPSALRPTSFRLTAITGYPTQTAPSTPDPNSLTLIPENRYETNYNNNTYQVCPPSAPFGQYTPIQNVSWNQDSTALLFNIPANRIDLFREPTLLIKAGVPAGSNLRCGPLNYLMASSSTNPMLIPYLSTSGNGGIVTTATCPFYASNSVPDNLQYIGIYMGAFPLAWNFSVITTTSTTSYIANAFTVPSGNGKPVTYRLQYENPPGSGVWVTYDAKCVVSQMYNGGINIQSVAGARPNWLAPAYEIGNDHGRSYVDPRTARMGTAACNWAYNYDRQTWEWPPTYSGYTASGPESAQEGCGAASPPGNYTANSADQYAAAQNAIWSIRPDTYNGFKAYPFPSNLGYYQTGFSTNALAGGTIFRPGMWSQNNPAAEAGGWAAANGIVPHYATALCFYADPDNVVRRGMAGYVQPSYLNGAGDSEEPPVTGGASGEPQSVATSFSAAGVGTPISTEQPSRPIILSRPFRTVGELGYVFSGTAWRNLDLWTPESGFSALLDVFCVKDSEDPDGLVAGKVNLNTRQAPVLQAILAGAYEDEYGMAPFLSASTGSTSASVVANALVQRTSDITGALGTGSGPLQNLSELVGKWTGPVAPGNSGITGNSLDGSQSYSGFSGMPTVTGTVAQNPPNLSYILASDTSANGYNLAVVERYRESTVRALSTAGQTRVWNLLIDMVAQTGRFPSSAAGAPNPLAAFMVEGQQHYWVHVAIDRFTGQVIDKQVEVVKE